MSATRPWLGIPARDYEAHMDEIGQAAALREIGAGYLRGFDLLQRLT